MEEDRLKQRLVGAIVLVALAVIFIPMLLNGGGRDMDMPVFGSNVPERSKEIANIKHIDIKEMEKAEPHPVNPKRIPVAENLPEPEIVEENKTLLDSIVKMTKEEEKPTIKQTVWAVQIGSFSNRENALALKEKLRKKKTHAFVERIMKDNKPIYRVRVGPETSRENAEKLKQKLMDEFKLKGLVVKHP